MGDMSLWGGLWEVNEDEPTTLGPGAGADSLGVKCLPEEKTH